MIYHIPAGRDGVETGAEEWLDRYKGKLPIVVRTYDAHSPYKTSPEYLLRYHDLGLTYMKQYVNGDNIRYARLCFDNHLFGKWANVGHRTRGMCMVLGNRMDPRYHIGTEEFKKRGLDLVKTYHRREEVAQIEEVDLYGHGWEGPLPSYKGPLSPTDKKHRVMRKYEFSIVLENCIVDSYVSEKILDCLIDLSIPVYLGSPTVGEDIPECCFIQLDPAGSLREQILAVRDTEEREVRQYQSEIAKHRGEVFSRYSTENNFSRIVYEWYNTHVSSGPQLSDEYYSTVEDEITRLRPIESGLADDARNFIKEKVLRVIRPSWKRS